MSRHHGQRWTLIGNAAIVLGMASIEAWAQDPLENAPLAPGSAARLEAGDKAGTSEKPVPESVDKAVAKTKTTPRPEFIVKSPDEWRKVLTRVQFAIGRGKSTEPPFSGKYATGHFRGIFVCACCEAADVRSELFSSQAKFESGTGWPSFYQALNNKSIQTAWDYLEAEPRVEVMCRRCGAHLGHVFDDGPPPTGLRFCINSAVIKLIPAEGEDRSKNVSSKTSSRSKGAAKSKTSAKSAPKQTGATDAAKPEESASAPAELAPAPTTNKAGTSTAPSSSEL